MTIEFETEFNCNSMCWITSLEANEVAWSREIIAELEPIFGRNQLPFRHHEIDSADALLLLLDEIAEGARQGMRPMLHMYMHGNDQGLVTATEELVPWGAVVPRLRAINVASNGNLCLVVNACHAYNAISQVDIREPSPIHMLIAPESEVFVDFLKTATVEFYEELFYSLQINKAFEKHLSDQLRIFIDAHFFTALLARYIKSNCLGEGGQKESSASYRRPSRRGSQIRLKTANVSAIF